MDRKIIIGLLVLLILTGCWDKVEIEDRAHISAVGIDKYKFPEDDGENETRYVFTFAFPEHKTGEHKDIVISTVGETLYSVSKIMADRSNKEFFFGHLRTVVISSDVAKDSKAFRQVLDGIENNELLSRHVMLAIAESTAEEVINVVPSMESMIGEFVAELFRRKDRIPRTVGKNIGDTLRDLHENGNAVIAKIIPGEADVKVSGAGIINNYQFKGWLGEVDTAYLLVLKGDAKWLGGMSVRHKDHTTPVNIRVHKSRYKLVEDENNIKILAEIKMEGEVKQTSFEAEQSMLDHEVMKEVERLVREDTERKLRNSITTIQKEFRTDVLGIDKYLRQSHHKLWHRLEKDWTEIFPNIDIDVSVDIKIRRIGLVK